MANLTLTGQASVATAIKTKIDDLTAALDLRKNIWDSMTREKRADIITNWKQDPIMLQAYNLYLYLRDNFFGEKYL